MREGVQDELRRTGATVIDGRAVVMTRDAYAKSIGYDRDGKPVSVTARFEQGEWWRRKTGEWIRVAEMSAGHRYNTAAMLMRNAAHHAFAYSYEFSGAVGAHDGGDMAHDALERAADEITRQSITDPRRWLAGTALYRALTAGLTIQGDGRDPWQRNGRDPVTGEPCDVPPPMTRVCEIPDCGCSGAAHA